MKLTNAIREQFVSSVMRATKMKSKWDKDKILAEISKRLHETVPEDIKAFAAKYPHVVVRSSVRVGFMDHIQENKENKHRWWVQPSASTIIGPVLADIDTSDLKEAWEVYRAEVAKREEMEEKLMEIAREMTTDEMLAAALPKLVKFIPKPVVKVKAGLPVAMKGIQDELAALGLEVSK